MIRIEDISYKAGRAGGKILDSLSCTILPGELTVLLGANGAGKSTLLHILSGEKAPSEGRVWWDDRLLHTIPMAEMATRRAMLSQHTTVNLPFTVGEIVLMGRYPHYRNNPSGKDLEIVSESMEEMQVAHLAGRSFHTLSGGEQQRVQMARALAQLGEVREDSRMLLLDEPTASLDWLHQHLCLQKAKELAKEGYTVVVVLHDLNLAAQFADVLLLLKNGGLLAAGARDEVLRAGTIQKAYGIETAVLYPEGCSFPVVVPATSKNIPTLIKEKTYAND